MQDAALQRKLKQRIHEFDPLSLLLLLKHWGYNLDQIIFYSHADIVSQDSLFRSIDFYRHPRHYVKIEVNMGLLGSQSTLPSYFFKRMNQDNTDVGKFTDFMHFLDHPMLLTLFRSIYPEIDTRIFPDYEESKALQLQLLNIRSPASLHQFFQIAFPELVVKVDKTVLKREIKSRPFIVGRNSIGSNHFLGSTFKAHVQGIRVDLFSEEEFCNNGDAWVNVINRRLEQFIFPILKKAGAELEVYLVLLGEKQWARLHAGQLGYDVFKGGQTRARRMRVFSGNVLN